MAEEIRLSKSFIETELPQAPPLYVSVYLMTLAVGQDAKKVAERLKATETDVLYAWGYWKGKGYLQEEQRQEPQRPALTSSARPDYSPRELALYIKNDKVRKLFDSAQKKLGKMLSQQDMSLLFSFYDWLGLADGGHRAAAFLLHRKWAYGHALYRKGCHRLGGGRREYRGKGSGIY